MARVGDRLAHVTCAEHLIFKLSIYDTFNLTSKPAQHITLPGFEAGNKSSKPKVQQILFSPDSTYLAVSRSDNVTHVYDSRYLRQPFLQELPHGPATEGATDDCQYGISKIEWIEDPTYGLGLITCGADGSFFVIVSYTVLDYAH
jgi:WD40 repeat protein